VGLFSRHSPNLEALEEDIQKQSRRVGDAFKEIEEVQGEIAKRFRDVEERLEAHQRAVRLMAEELDERIDRGNKIWRKIRASEYYEANRDRSEEDEDANFELHFGNGEGSPEEGVPTVHQSMVWPGRPPTKAQEVGKALARRIAGID